MVRPFRTTSLDLRAGGVFVATALILGLSGVACNKMPLTAPSGSSITLIAATNTLPVNGSTQITAVVIEGGESNGAGNSTTVTPGAGTPVQNGTQVSFTTSLGSIQPSTAETHDGKAVVTLSGNGQSGTATITAISGPASKTMTVAIGAAGANHISVTANPQALPATGGTSTIIASVQDAQGNGLLGVPVSFSTTAGTLSATNVISDSAGNATTQLTTSAAATVTASSGGATAALTGTVAVTLNSKLNVTITPPTSLTVSVPATFTVNVTTTGTGAPLANDVVIDFGDGNSASLGQISGSTTVQNLYGQSGPVTVTVKATDPTGTTTTVSSKVIVAPLQAVGASSFAAQGGPGVGDSVLFTVTPSTGAIISSYVWDFGEGDGPQTTFTNTNQHAFRTAGVHNVLVTVNPAAGPSLPVPIQVSIHSVPDEGGGTP